MVGHMYGSRIRPPATPLVEVKNGCRRIITTTPVAMFGRRTPQILTQWIIMYGMLLGKTPIAVPVLKSTELISRIKAVFKTLPRESVSSASSRFQDRIEAVIDANGAYFDLSMLTIV